MAKKNQTTQLLVVRHGAYDDYTLHLNEYGKEQIGELSKKIAERTKGKNIMVLSSTANRAIESAAIIADNLGVPYDTHDILWSENKHRENLRGALELIKSVMDQCDTIIIVTHLEYTQSFPGYFAKYHLNETLQYYQVNKGEMVDINWGKSPVTAENVTWYDE